MSILDQAKKKMEAAIEHFKNELKNIRTGRANPGMIEHVQVEVYGSPMRLKEVASITVPEPRQLLITPFDRSHASVIGKSIEKANLGFMPIVDANAVRIQIPPMTEETRKKMVKIAQEEREKAKVSVRNIRRDSNEAAKKQKSEGLIAEDVMKKLEKQIQELTDKFCQEADKLTDEKEKEITKI